MFSILALKISSEGDKILRKKTGEALAETVFFARLRFMLYTPSQWKFRKIKKKWKILDNFGQFCKMLYFF